MPFITAPLIHNGIHFLPTGSIIEVAADGTILGIHNPGTIAEAQIQHYEGILCPGFVNVHCHTELSHMLGKIEEGNGLVRFLQSVMLQRNTFSEADKKEAMSSAFAYMKSQGIVAVGDIANTADSLTERSTSGLHVHTFVESIGFTEDRAEERFAWPQKVYEQHSAQSTEQDVMLRQSIVPHAPYSVSPQLFALINKHQRDSIISIHNEETPAENEYFHTKTGLMKELYETLNINDDFFSPSGKSSLQTYLPYLSPAHPLILVHNTCMNEQDIAVLQSGDRAISLCLCPNANWYIERKMPPVEMLAGSGLNICLGTDSLASNHQLSIMEEIKTIRLHFPAISMEQLLKWATYNGAITLQMDSKIGSIEKGKKPGIIQIEQEKKVNVLW